MEYIRGIKQTTSLSLDGQWLYLRAASLCLYPLIFIHMEVKIIFSPFSLTLLQVGLFVDGCVMSLRVRALETQRLLLLLFHAKYQSGVRGLSWAVLKDENVIVVTA